MHALERSGTRHRAAIGASEMGDTVVVVVSEERGKTSIAVNGRLFEMHDTKELEANLSYLLGLTASETGKSGISKIFERFRKRPATAEAAEATTESGQTVSKETEEQQNVSSPLVIKTKEADQTSNAQRVSVGTRVIFLILSLFLSLFLWLYIQIDNNPVVSRNISVPISYPEEQNYRVSFPIDEVELNIVGRRNTINSLTSKDIVVTIDYASLPDSKEGIVEVPVVVTSKDKNVYFRVERRFPQTVKVVKFRSQS
jgi:hypothetical protein